MIMSFPIQKYSSPYRSLPLSCKARKLKEKEMKNPFYLRGIYRGLSIRTLMHCQ
jgi:hypothetical protein